MALVNGKVNCDDNQQVMVIDLVDAINTLRDEINSIKQEFHDYKQKAVPWRTSRQRVGNKETFYITTDKNATPPGGNILPQP